MGDARKILVVDDDPAVRKSVDQVLSGKGHAVITASSGEDALWELDNGQFDAVFTGIVLRGMSGLEMAEEIRARQTGLPVVIVTGHGSEAAKKRAAAAGVTEFLEKTLPADELAAAAERVLKAARPAATMPSPAQATNVATAQAASPTVSRLKNVVLFLLAPLISLFYLLTFPIIGLGMLIYMTLLKKEERPEAAEALRPAPLARSSILKAMGMILAMGVSGVVYGILGPILGVGLVLWFGFQAWGRLGSKAMGSGRT